MKKIIINLVLIIGLLLSFSIHAEKENKLRFIAIGDTPYSDQEEKDIKKIIKPAIQNVKPSFIVHYGDIKDGGSDCTKVLLKKRRNDIYSLLPGLVFYTPGDNEWTDCDRASMKNPVSELKMLELIRDLFFKEKEPIRLPENEDWAYKRQDIFSENAQWIKQDVLFTTVHLVGTNNGRQEIRLDDPGLALALVDARDQANRVWLEDAFNQAKSKKAKAVVIITQADVTNGGSGSCADQNNRMNCDAFADFRSHLQRYARNFQDSEKRGKPVLLIHGDTNPYCWDKKFGGETAPNLWRLNAWGDFQTPTDATEIIVQPDNSSEPFLANTLITQKQPASVCEAG